MKIKQQQECSFFFSVKNVFVSPGFINTSSRLHYASFMKVTSKLAFQFTINNYQSTINTLFCVNLQPFTTTAVHVS